MGKHIFEQLAHERNITVEEMWAIIFARIECFVAWEWLQGAFFINHKVHNGIVLMEVENDNIGYDKSVV